MKQEDPQFKLRLKPELKARLEESARENTRTLGAEIVARLEDSLDGEMTPAMALAFAQMQTELTAKNMVVEGRELGFVTAVFMLQSVLKQTKAELPAEEERVFSEMLTEAAKLADRRSKSLQRAEKDLNASLQTLRKAHERFHAAGKA